MTPRTLIVGFFAVLLAACQHAAPQAALQNAPGCEAGPVQLTQAFSGAPDSPCVRTGPADFSLTITPETTPINPSPWYAFDISADADAPMQTARVTLRYDHSRHRYIPKHLTAQGWTPLPESAVVLSPDARTATLTLALPANGQAQSVRVAAQEVLSLENRQTWRRDLADRSGFNLSTIGQSVQGRPIEALTRASPDPSAPLIVILGGQHPPEVPGALGLRAFMQSLTAVEDASPQSLDGASWLVIPTLNPDGAEAGFWRLNEALTDLNRDWGPFAQPETSAAADAIEEALVSAGGPLLLLDFHATRRDVLYVPQGQDGARTHPLVEALIAATRSSLAPDMDLFDISPGYNPGLPTSKTWFLEAYGAPGVTVEFGDETPRPQIHALGAALAQALLQVIQTQGEPAAP